MSKSGPTLAAMSLVAISLFGAPPALLAEDRTIEISGSGMIVKPLEFAHPGETVIVKVCPADFINYEYTVTETEDALKEGFPIVGIEPPPSTATGGMPSAPLAISAQIFDLGALKTSKDEDKELLHDYLVLRNDISVESQEVDKTVGPVNLAALSPLFPAGADCTARWPSAITDQAGDGKGSIPFLNKFLTRTQSLNVLDSRQKALLARFQELDLRDKIPPGAKASDLRVALKTAVTNLQGTLEALRASLETTRKVVDRWARIIALNPEPVLTQKYLMPQTSKLISVSVGRKPVTDTAANEKVGVTDLTKIISFTIASTKFENRAFYHFNVSLGMVGTWKDRSRDFDIVSSVDASSTVTYHLRETKRDQSATEAAVFLGIYLNPAGVDPFDLKRGGSWMVMLGSEISSSPKDFFLGIGHDSASGVVWGIGLTEYQSVDLGPGLRAGQEIPVGTDGKPKLATISKVSKDTLGAYAFLGFRPSIFKAFLTARKP
jgi:hypothetical protein